jgi:hypothetical protein
VILIVVFLLGVLAGMVLLWKAMPHRLKRHIDYKQRWEDAVHLLGTEGNLTAEQVRQITVPSPPQAACATSPQAALPSLATKAALRSMASWDRKDIEITRAQRGLPPVDDLTGMATWDKKDVLEARARAGTG